MKNDDARLVPTLLFLVILAGVACAQEAAVGASADSPQGLLPRMDLGGDWQVRSRLSGDWGGVRQDWADHGLFLDLDWTQTAQRVTSGGRDIRGAYGGSFDVLVRADLARMDLVPGAMLTLRTESRYGDSVNGDSGLLLPVNSDAAFPLTSPPDADLAVAITELNYTQFVSEQLGFVVGKIQTLDGDLNELASGRGRHQFMNFQLVANPVTALTVPYSALAGGAVWLPASDTVLTSMVMTTGDASTTTGFDELDRGLTWVTEARRQYRVGDLPGGMNVAGIYAFDGDFTKVRGKLGFTPGAGIGIESQSSSWGAYWSGWQYLTTKDPVPETIDVADGRADVRGLGVFARLGVADRDTNFVSWSGSVGLGGRGLIAGREEDSFGLGYFHNGLQQPRAILVNLLDQSSRGLEAYYQVAVSRSVQVALDAQWADSAFAGLDDSVMIGARLDIRF